MVLNNSTALKAESKNATPHSLKKHPRRLQGSMKDSSFSSAALNLYEEKIECKASKPN
jgi:hypothetical protein